MEVSSCYLLAVQFFLAQSHWRGKRVGRKPEGVRLLGKAERCRQAQDAECNQFFHIQNVISRKGIKTWALGGLKLEELN